MDVQGSVSQTLASEGIGEEIYALAAEIYPICRSITGNGVRATLRHLGPTRRHRGARGADRHAGLRLDSAARVEHPRCLYQGRRGRKIVDFANSNLHVMSYSRPVRARMRLAELKQHLHSLPQQPDLIPYRTSYYAENWGFCIPHRQLEALRDETYEVVIDSSLEDGALDLWRVLPSGQYRRRGFAVGAHLPSLTRQRQLLGACATRPFGQSHRPATRPATATGSCSLRARSVR